MKIEKRKKKKKTCQGDKRFAHKAWRQGEVVDFLGQDSGRYNYHIKYTPPS